jgi:PTS system nitrogen regulatory IIA component
VSAIDIASLLSPDRVVVGLRAVNKDSLLNELARRAAPAAGIEAGVIHDALEARERLGSTGAGRGIAIPHAQLPGLRSFVGLFVRLDRLLDYEAIDDEPVDLVFLLLSPGVGRDHVRALSAVARRLRHRATVQQLREAHSAVEIHRLLTQGATTRAS